METLQQIQNITEDNIECMLNLVQESAACHRKYSIALKKALESQDDGKLFEAFIKRLHVLLVHDYKKKNVFVDRVIRFLITFCGCLKTTDHNDETDHPILSHFMEFLLKYTKYDHDPCRYWSCKIIGEIMENTDQISEELFDKIRDGLLERLADSKSVIRLEAIHALHRFQDPTNQQDPVIKHLHEMMDSDLNANVRQLSVNKIGLNKQVLPSLLNRTRDVNVNVRLAAFKRITPLPTYLTINQRRLLLQCGFLDSSDKIKNYVNTVLLEEWLAIYDNNYFQLMKSLRLDACQEDIKKTIFFVEHTLNSLFKTKSVHEIKNKVELNDQKLLNYDNLNWESVLYYRIAVEYLRKSDCFDDDLDDILPELVVFTKYIEEYVQHVKDQKVDILEHHFILEQLFVITAGYDISDEVSRRSLNSLLHFMLQNNKISLDLGLVLIQVLEKTIPNVTNRSMFVCEIVSNIMYGEDAIDYKQQHIQETERKHQISEIKSEIMSLRENEQQCVLNQNFLEADLIQTQIKNEKKLLQSLESFQGNSGRTERKTDAPTIIRALTVAEAFLRSPLVEKLNPILATLSLEYIQKNLVHEDIAVKVQAFRCYALCCIIDLKSAKYGIHIFSAPILCHSSIEDTDVDILIVAIKTVVDLLIQYGVSLVESREDVNSEEPLSRRSREDAKVFIGGTSIADLVKSLADLLDHENPDVEEAATKCICSLLFNNCITSTSLMSRIIIKWANPATDNERLKQFLGHALNAISSEPNCLSNFSDVVISTVKTLVYAPSSSPLCDINIDDISKFMIRLCQISSNGSEIHADIAIKICSYMIDKPRHKVVLYFSRILLLLTVPKNEDILNDLLQVCDQLRDKITNSKINKNIVKFNAKLEQSLHEG